MHPNLFDVLLQQEERVNAGGHNHIPGPKLAKIPKNSELTYQEGIIEEVAFKMGFEGWDNFDKEEC